MKDYIIQTLKISKGSAYYIFKKNEELVRMLDERYPLISDINIKIQLYIQDLDDIPKCKYSKCNNQTKLHGTKFSITCSSICRAAYMKETGIYKINAIKTSKKLLNKSDNEKSEIRNKVKKTYIENYGTDHPMKNDSIKKKHKETVFKNYGADHFMQSEKVKEKQKQSIVENYGVENYTLTDHCKNKNMEKYGKEYFVMTDVFKIKSKNTSVEKYGVTNHTKKNFNPIHANIFEDKTKFENLLYKYGTYKLAHIINCSISSIYAIANKYSIQLPPRSKSRQEEIILDFLIQNNIQFISNTKKVLPSGKELDFYFSDHNLAIEINRLYWHSEISGGKNRNYHYDKWKECSDNGITLLSIYEDEFDQKQKFWLNKILYMTGNISLKKIHARKCEIRELDNVTDFLNSHHLQGSNTSKYKFGLFYENELVSCMTFSNTRDNKSGVIDLSRFCNHSDYIVSGGASKLLNYFIKKYGSKYKSIVSFSDNNYSNGNVYKALGFYLNKNLSPDYKYIINGIQYHKSGFRKDRIFKNFVIPEIMIDSTEWELMKYLGYDRIWDTGKKKWELKISS